VQEFDRNLSVSQVLTMEQAVADATAQPRFEMLLLALAGGVALILAAVGIYGVMNYAVVRRTREIGIRISLGASRGDVLGMVFRRALLQALAGTAVGIAGAVLLSKFMAKMVFGVRPTDPWTFAAVTVLLAIAAVAASGIPARRASRIQPMQALRSE
jgi:putative ABC transport system permease protein